jgi:hypothetical protein
MAERRCCVVYTSARRQLGSALIWSIVLQRHVGLLSVLNLSALQTILPVVPMFHINACWCIPTPPCCRGAFGAADPKLDSFCCTVIWNRA